MAQYLNFGDVRKLCMLLKLHGAKHTQTHKCIHTYTHTQVSTCITGKIWIGFVESANVNFLVLIL